MLLKTLLYPVKQQTHSITQPYARTKKHKALLRIANRKENTWVSTSRKLKDDDSLSGSATRLASGKAPKYPREPTIGAFLDGAQERFDGIAMPSVNAVSLSSCVHDSTTIKNKPR